MEEWSGGEDDNYEEYISGGDDDDLDFILTPKERDFCIFFTPSSFNGLDTTTCLYLSTCLTEYIVEQWSNPEKALIAAAFGLRDLVRRDEPWDSDKLRDFLVLFARVTTLFNEAYPPFAKNDQQKMTKIWKEVGDLVLCKAAKWPRDYPDYDSLEAPPNFNRYYDDEALSHPPTQTSPLFGSSKQSNEASSSSSNPLFILPVEGVKQQQGASSDPAPPTTTKTSTGVERSSLKTRSDTPYAQVSGGSGQVEKQDAPLATRRCTGCGEHLNKGSFA